MATGTHGKLEGYPAFEKWFAPYSYKAIIMEEYMSDLQHETGYIAKVLTSPKNAQWRGYVLQKDDNKAYSVTLSEKVPADLRAELAILAVKDYVTFHYKESTGKDNQGKDKTYFNIYGLERPEKQQEEPSDGQPSPTPDAKKLSDMMLCNVTNNGSMIFCEYIKNANTLAEVDNDVLINLFNTIADWHRENAG